MPEANDFGILHLPSGNSLDGVLSPRLWGEYELNWILVIAAVLFVIVNLRNFKDIYQAVIGCAYRWKSNMTIERSLQQSGARNVSAAACILPFCLVMSRFAADNDSFLNICDEKWRSLAVIAVLTGFMILRRFCYNAGRYQGIPEEVFRVGHRCIRNYFIIATALIVATACVLSVCGANDLLIKKIVLVEFGLAYLMFLTREKQIFDSICHGFRTFLYLCSLEILPVAVTAVILIWVL